MTEPVRVREGTVTDLDAVMALAAMLHAESGLVDLTPERILPEIWAALNFDKGIMGVIGPRGGPLQGAILLRIGPYFYYSDQDALQERGLIVHPDYRTVRAAERSHAPNRQPHAVMLCEFAKHAADRLEMPLFLSITKESGVLGKAKLFDRQFGLPVGSLYRYLPSDAAKTEAA